MTYQLNIPKQLRRRVDREVQPGEVIRWIEQPVPRFLDISSISTVLFAIPWTGFAIFWTFGAAGFKVPDLSQGIKPEHLFALFGLPFILVGLGMLSSPFWVWRKTLNTVYVITDRRAISFEGKTIRSYAPEQLGNLYRHERSNGTIGSVIISTRNWTDSDGDKQSQEIGFIDVRNPQDVERRLRDLHDRASS